MTHQTKTIRITLDVAVAAKDANALSKALLEEVQSAIRRGVLDLCGTQTVCAQAGVAEDPIDEDELAAYMLMRVESGDLDLEDIPTRLARYGLMERDAFLAEMHERMGGGL